jgi:hypothetical protein
VLLLIAHGNMNQVPKLLDFSLLINIVDHASKYDMIHQLGPWAERWLQGTEVEARNRRDHVMRLREAYELGCESVVAAEFRTLVRESCCEETEHAELFFSGDKTHLDFGHRLGPQDLKGKY